jgi:hypothetical protein
MHRPSAECPEIVVAFVGALVSRPLPAAQTGPAVRITSHSHRHVFDEEISMRDRDLRGNWSLMKAGVLAQWSRVTAEDIAHLAGEREALMRVLKDRYKDVARSNAK